MVVTCPNCRARYAVDPQKIGFKGRTVQCARCSHRWFEKVEGPEPAPPPPAPAPAPKPEASKPEVPPAVEATSKASEAEAEVEPKPKPPVAETAPPESKSAPRAEAEEEEEKDEEQAQPTDGSEPVPEVVIRPTTPGAALPVVVPERSGFPWRRAAIATLVALVLVGGAAFAFRDKIMALIPEPGPTAAAPPAAPAAAPPASTAAATAPRPPAAQPRARLEIDLSASKIDVVDGRYVVRGEIVNKGTAAGSTSLLRVTFKKNDEVMADRTFPLVEGPLPPGGRASFSQVLENPPAGATDIVPTVE